MYPDYCEKCNSKHFFIKENKNQTGVYCSRCGKWQKWLSKEERKVYMNITQKKRAIIKDNNLTLSDMKKLLDIVDKVQPCMILCSRDVADVFENNLFHGKIQDIRIVDIPDAEMNGNVFILPVVKEMLHNKVSI